MKIGKDGLVGSVPFRPVDRCLVAGLAGAGAIPNGEKGHLEKSHLQFSLEHFGNWVSTQPDAESAEKELVFRRSVFIELDSEKVWLKPIQQEAPSGESSRQNSFCQNTKNSKKFDPCMTTLPVPLEDSF